MQKKTVTHERPGEPLSVTVGEADVLMGMRHGVLINEAQVLIFPERFEGEGKQSEEPDEKKADPRRLEGDEFALSLIRRYTWPNCKAAAIGSEGFDYATLTFEDFCRMPERFAYNWEQAVLELNPHWGLVMAKSEEEEEEEKKDGGASASA